ncbi:hypothetical protein VPH35_027119 [Triticum aestivum]
MNHRFVNLLVNKLCAPQPAFNVHCINSATLFYPGGSPKAAADLVAINETALGTGTGRLPSPTISFDWPCRRHQPGGCISCPSRTTSSLYLDHEGCNILYDTALRSIRAMPLTNKPRSKMISFTVDNLYVMDWHWSLLPQPTFDFPDDDEDPSNYGPEEAVNPYVASSYTVYGDLQIWISTAAASVYSYGMVSGQWSKGNACALPFRGRAENKSHNESRKPWKAFGASVSGRYNIPDHGLWFGFSREDEQLCAADLTEARSVLHEVWEYPTPPDPCSMMASHLLLLGSGKLCVARLFHKTERRELFPSVYTKAESSVVLSGVETLRVGST